MKNMIAEYTETDKRLRAKHAELMAQKVTRFRCLENVASLTLICVAIILHQDEISKSRQAAEQKYLEYAKLVKRKGKLSTTIVYALSQL